MDGATGTTERDPQWLRGVLPCLVLALLHRGEAYGYELTKKLESSGMGVIKGGTLYPVLARLEAEGLVYIRWSEPRSGPARKYYRLTAKGRDQYQRLAQTWLEFTEHAGSLLNEALQEVKDG